MRIGIEYSVIDNQKKSNINLDMGGSPIDNTLSDFIERIKAAQVLIAKAVLREEQGLGFDKKPTVIIDGRRGRVEEEVRPFGKIEYYARLKDLDSLIKIYEAIEKRSPVRSGLYKDSNYVFANNKLVATNIAEFIRFVKVQANRGMEDLAEIRFVNVTPYAARLEYSGTRMSIGGRNKGSNVSKGKKGKSKYNPANQVKRPNGAYYLASRTLSSVKGFFAQTKFEFIPNGYKGLNFDSHSMFRTTYVNSQKNQSRRRVGKPYVYPSLVFRISDKGVFSE